MPDVAGFIERNIGEQALKDMDAKRLVEKVVTSPTVTSPLKNVGNKIHNLTELLKKIK